jgi:endonuclease-3
MHDIPRLLDRLEALHGRAERRLAVDPLDELVACILSQHTSDINTARAFEGLRRAFPSWEAVAQAPAESVADAIRCGGLADTKAPRIQAVLRAVAARFGRMDLADLDAWPTPEARAFLMGLPGVGPKTAAIVLCFAMGRPVLPVDTHVFRVSWQLGLVPKQAGEARAHDLLQPLVPDELVYRFHIALIRHGRAVCRAQRPRCGECPLASVCPVGEAMVSGLPDPSADARLQGSHPQPGA